MDGYIPYPSASAVQRGSLPCALGLFGRWVGLAVSGGLGGLLGIGPDLKGNSGLDIICAGELDLGEEGV